MLYQMFWSPEALWQHPGVTSRVALGFGLSGCRRVAGFRVCGLGLLCWISGLGFRVSGFGVSSLGFGVSEFGVSEFKLVGLRRCEGFWLGPQAFRAWGLASLSL